MPQAIKEFSGTVYQSSYTQEASIYVCPADTIAIVLPNILFVPSTSGASGGVGWNSSSYSNYNTSTGTGNIAITAGDANYPYQISHDDKHKVRIGLMLADTNSFFYYSPAFTTSLKNYAYSMKENQNNWLSSNAIFSAIVGDAVVRGPSSNYAYYPSSFTAGTWCMGAGDRLSLNSFALRIQYSFLIIEEPAG